MNTASWTHTMDSSATLVVPVLDKRKLPTAAKVKEFEAHVHQAQREQLAANILQLASKLWWTGTPTALAKRQQLLDSARSQGLDV